MAYSMKRRRDHDTAFRFSGRVSYEWCGDDGAVIATVPHFASPSCCDELVALCEAEGWVTEQGDYSQATVDMEVDAHPRVRDFLLAKGLVRALERCMMATHGRGPTGFGESLTISTLPRTAAPARGVLTNPVPPPPLLAPHR